MVMVWLRNGRFFVTLTDERDKDPFECVFNYISMSQLWVVETQKKSVLQI